MRPDPLGSNPGQGGFTEGRGRSVDHATDGPAIGGGGVARRRADPARAGRGARPIGPGPIRGTPGWPRSSRPSAPRRRSTRTSNTSRGSPSATSAARTPPTPPTSRRWPRAASSSRETGSSSGTRRSNGIGAMKYRHEEISACDGERTRTVVAGNCANIHLGRWQHPAISPAHSLPLAHYGINFPLSIYLSGTEAIHAYLEYPRELVDSGPWTRLPQGRGPFRGRGAGRRPPLPEAPRGSLVSAE